MIHRRPILRASLFLVVSLLLAGCRGSGFDPSDPVVFDRQCREEAVVLAGVARTDPSLVADVFAMFDAPPMMESVKRRFDPFRPPEVAGSGAVTRHDLAAACAHAAGVSARLAGVSGQAAFEGGLSQWLSALQVQSVDAKDMQDTIKDAVSGKRRASGRVSELIGRFAPRGTEFRAVRKGTRMVPTVVIEAVNPLDLPIEAFFFALDLKRPDDSVLASGRFTFKPPAPLGPGVSASYRISLDSIGGFQTPEVEDVRDKVSIKVRTEDVVSGGSRLLSETIVDPEDARRIDAMGVLRGRVEEIRDLVRRIREKVVG